MSGASDVFWGGQVTYDNSAKEILGVPAQLLIEHGAVSAEVARSMAEEGLKRMTEKPGRSSKGEPLCVSVTGIAGPGGGTAEKPVGLCYIAIARTAHETQVEEVRGRTVWHRDYMKTFFAQKALDLVWRKISS